MPALRQNTHGLSAIAQLACLGEPGDSVLEDLLRVLRGVVGFDVSSYAALDEREYLRDFRVSAHVPQQVAATYVRQWYRQRENAHYDGALRPAMSLGHYDCVRMSDVMPRLQHTAYFDELMRPAGLAHGARAMLRGGGQGDAPLGMLSLGRSRGQRNFSAHDMAHLRAALPHLAHAMARRGGADAAPADAPLHGVESALVLVDRRGCIQSGSDAAWTLLARAAGRALVADTVRDLALAWAQPWLAALVQRMEGLLLGRPGRPPVVAERNRYGTFYLRGYVLDAGGGAMAGMYAVQIERRVPLAQRLFASAAFLDLTARERDVCLHLARGAATDDIARALGLKASTVVTHTRNIYDRLSINQRAQLVPALLQE